MDIKDATELDLIREILRRNPLQRGPTSTVHVEPVSQSIVALGKDAIIDIRICESEVPLLETEK